MQRPATCRGGAIDEPRLPTSPRRRPDLGWQRANVTQRVRRKTSELAIDNTTASAYSDANCTVMPGLVFGPARVTKGCGAWTVDPVREECWCLEPSRRDRCYPRPRV